MKNGELIRTLRKQAGVKAIDLAKMLGVTRSYISQVENGTSAASDELVSRVCKVLNIERPLHGPVSVSGNHGVVAVQSPGARVNQGVGDSPPAWAVALTAEVRALHEAMEDVRGLLIKLLKK